ncbi:MAG: hypothetical protein A3K59_10005 [Euryarchaeota archaeon RBG_19FT_COMBO_69_17]|nr:MAG: hypothetical protein A3K59_10005 [Euryarchaeota archaeon RBG_19FT_COMBO_69_17]
MSLPKGLWAALSGVEAPATREDLALLSVSLQVRFGGRAAGERAVAEFMAARFGWAAARTRRRLEGLVDLGVVRCTRDLADGWSKVFEVLDRPPVPGVFAAEMGA